MGNSDSQKEPEPSSNDNTADEKEIESKLAKLDIAPHLILMGDSVLDNIAWLTDTVTNLLRYWQRTTNAFDSWRY